MINIKPHITEKSVNLVKLNKYTFIVPAEARSSEIERLIINTYKVTIEDLNVIREKPQIAKRAGKERLIRADKKVIVTLKKGETLPGFEIATEKDGKKEKGSIPTTPKESRGDRDPDRSVGKKSVK